MKKLLTFTLLLTLIQLIGCKKTDNAEAKATAGPDSMAILSADCSKLKLPLTLNDDATIDSVDLDSADSVLTVVMSIHDDLFDSTAVNPDSHLRTFYLGLMLDNDTAGALIENARKVPVGIKLTLNSFASNQTVTCLIPPARLQTLQLEAPELRDRDVIKVMNRVRADNAECPFEIEEGVTITGMTVQDRYVTFRTEIDIEKLDFLVMKENRDSLSHAVNASLREQLKDSLQRKSLLDISDARLGYRNRYIASDRKDSFDIAFTADDLLKLINVTDSLNRK